MVGFDLEEEITTRVNNLLHLNTFRERVGFVLFVGNTQSQDAGLLLRNLKDPSALSSLHKQNEILNWFVIL